MDKLIENDLIAGAIDLHAHGYPEISLSYKGRVTDHDWAKAAQELNVGGFVIKSHVWPTMERAYLLQDQFPDLRIYGAVTLNPNVGGLSPWTVESAIALGATALWFPTWSARFDIEHHGGKYFRSHLPFYNQLSAKDGIYLLEKTGELVDEAKVIIDMARDAGLVVGTGHISPAESIKLAEYCCDVGFRKLIFTHAMGVGANQAEMEAMAQLGGYIEFSYLHVLLQRFQISDIIDAVKKIGPEKCILTTDAFFSWTPPEPEMFRLFAGVLHYHGLEPHHIRQMVYDIPRKLLDLSEDDAGSRSRDNWPD